jgi:hypothetical protein
MTGTGVLGLLLTYHMAAAIALGSLLLAALNKWVPWVTNLGTWGKRITLLIGTIIVMVAIKALGGETPADFAALVKDTIEALVAAIVSGTIWGGAAAVTKDKIAGG